MSVTPELSGSTFWYSPAGEVKGECAMVQSLLQLLARLIVLAMIYVSPACQR
jgi:hypothetical protein